VIQNAGMGSPGAHLGQIGLERFQGLLHLLFGGFFKVCNHVLASF
jgi:hypothetical protein